MIYKAGGGKQNKRHLLHRSPYIFTLPFKTIQIKLPEKEMSFFGRTAHRCT